MSSTKTSEDLDVLEFFRAELSEIPDQPGDRVEAIHNLKIVAANVGPQRTRTDLLALLNENLVENKEADDEALFALAEELLTLCDYLGGEENYGDLIPLLEVLGQQEETVVRDRAIETMVSILEDKCSPDFQTKFAMKHLVSVLERLSKYDYFPSRVSACSLCPPLYAHVTDAKKGDIRRIFCELCNDDTPMVKRAAAAKLKDLMMVVSKNDILQNLLPTLNACWKDQLQDLIRAFAVRAAAQFAQRCTLTEIEQYVMPIAKGASQDPSWRVRMAIVNCLGQLAEVASPEMIETGVSIMLRDLLEDAEPELVTGAVAILPSCLPYMSGEVIEKTILPTFEPLIKEASPAIKASLAKTYGLLSKQMGKQRTMNLLVPQVSLLFHDKSRDVRLEITSEAANICEILGVQTASQALLPTIMTLMNDQQWRIRLALIKQLSRFAKFFSSDKSLKASWEKLWIAGLLDNVSAVREAAIENAESLSEEFGNQWTEDFLLGGLLDLCKKSFKKSSPLGTRQQTPIDLAGSEQANRSIDSYLTRTTLLHALEKVAGLIPKNEVPRKILPQLLFASKDDIPNVRFTAYRLLASLAERDLLSPDVIEEQIIPLLEDAQANDIDLDVLYFADKALFQCKSVIARSSSSSAATTATAATATATASQPSQGSGSGGGSGGGTQSSATLSLISSGKSPTNSSNNQTNIPTDSFKKK